MSFLTTLTGEMLATQALLEGINTNLAAQVAGAASATTVVAPAAADPVSIQQATTFSLYGTAFQATAADAQTAQEQWVTNLGTSAQSYADTEATNAANTLLQNADLLGGTNDTTAGPLSNVTASNTPAAGLLDWIQYLLGGTGNYTNSSMLGGMFGLSSNGANIGNIGVGNWASAMSDVLGLAGGGLLPAGSDTIGDAAGAAAGAADLASSTTPVGAGMAGMGMGGVPIAAGLGQGTLVGNLAVPPSWAGGQVAPMVSTSVSPIQTVGWTGAAPQAASGAMMPGMPGMVTGAGRSSAGFGAPRYGVKPIVMPKPATV